jgi:hypothetical protein
MRKLIGITIFLFVLSLAAAAQETSKAEVFGGYQFTSLDGWHGNGWDGAAKYNLSHGIGIKGDFSGAYSSGQHFYTYTFGPAISMPAGKFSPFAEALFGGAHATSGGFGNSGMAMLFGGGLDLGSQRLAFRLVQADWMITRFNGFTDKNNVRVSTGMVFRF